MAAAAPPVVGSRLGGSAWSATLRSVRGAPSAVLDHRAPASASKISDFFIEAGFLPAAAKARRRGQYYALPAENTVFGDEKAHVGRASGMGSRFGGHTSSTARSC